MSNIDHTNKQNKVACTASHVVLLNEMVNVTLSLSLVMGALLPAGELERIVLSVPDRITINFIKILHG
jgi:hypothetical protein